MAAQHFKIPIYLLLIFALAGRIMVTAVDSGPMDYSWKKALVKMTVKESSADEDGENEGKIKLPDLLCLSPEGMDFTLACYQESVFSTKDYMLHAADVQDLEQPPKLG
jgi:hypothetical protein